MTAEDSRSIPTVALRGADGPVPIPRLGFGVWQVPDDQVGAAVDTALQTGYRHIDTAAAYQNESGVGAALAASDLPSDEVFLTTKIWNDHQGLEEATEAFAGSRERLGRKVDLLLVHWPVPSQDKYVDTFRAILRLRDLGEIKVAGVCNFEPEHLQRLKDELGEYPAINQIELHPYLQQQELRDFHREHGIVTEAWSPLASGGEVLNDPVIGEIAQRLGVTPAQVILRWHLQLGNVVIPKSVTPERIRENFEVTGFELTDEDMAAIATLDRGERTGPDPKEFTG